MADIRPFDPLLEGHWLIGKICPLCHKTFQVGDVTAAIPDRPADEEEAEKKAAGRPYIAIATPVHWECVSAFDAVMLS